MKVFACTVLFIFVLGLIALCWLIGRCVQWMRRGYLRHE